mmetsp:Transcript_24272/g.37833  ORF Transcript_24272/g.37833 Transcript_24272/m.37833 type:complete len:85 (-) Transcript_24272:250-504(-)
MRLLLLFACVCVSGVLELPASDLVEAATYKPIDFELFDLGNFSLPRTKEQRLREQERKKRQAEQNGGLLKQAAMFLLIWFLAEA